MVTSTSPAFTMMQHDGHAERHRRPSRRSGQRGRPTTWPRRCPALSGRPEPLAQAAAHGVGRGAAGQADREQEPITADRQPERMLDVDGGHRPRPPEQPEDHEDPSDRAERHRPVVAQSRQTPVRLRTRAARAGPRQTVTARSLNGVRPASAQTRFAGRRRLVRRRRCDATCRPPPSPGQECHHVGIRGLVEAVVPLADGVERLRLLEHHHRVARVPELGDGMARGHGHGHDHLAAPWARATEQAARAVDPVAMPSSTTTAVRPDQPDAGLRPGGTAGHGDRALARSRASAVPISSSLMTASQDDVIVQHPHPEPSPMAPMASSRWKGAPSLRTTMTSNGAPSTAATW